MQSKWLKVSAIALSSLIGFNAAALDRTDVGPDHAPVPPKPASTAAPLEKFDPAEPIDDKQLYRLLETKGQALVTANSTLMNWKDKLATRTVALNLPQTPSDLKSLNPVQVFQRAESGVVVIGVMYKCDKCPRHHVATASGILLNESGAVATNFHVLHEYINNGTGVVVLTRDGRTWPVKDVLAADPANDLLAIQLDLSSIGDKPAGLTPIPLGTDAPAGAPITVISHPSQHFYFLTTGVAARYTRSDKVKFLNITADYAKGSSGAPVLNDRAQVVGMVRSTNSISYDQTQKAKDTHQMVIHNCAPVDALTKLVTTAYVPPPPQAEKPKPEAEAKKE